MLGIALSSTAFHAMITVSAINRSAYGKIKEEKMAIEFNFQGKTALITGASSGLGARFAIVLAFAGALVVLVARRVERLLDLRAEIEAGGGAAHVVSLDVTDPASIKSAIAHAETEAGAIDILVNNAGVSPTQKLIDVSPEDYAYVMDTNQRGAFFVAQETAKRMITRAKGDPSKQHRIINIASVAGLRVLPQIGIYCMSKAAVVHMTNPWRSSGASTASTSMQSVPAISKPKSTPSIFPRSRVRNWWPDYRASASASRKIWMAYCYCWLRKNRTSSTARS